MGRAWHAFTNPASTRWPDAKSGLTRFFVAALVDWAALPGGMPDPAPPAAGPSDGAVSVDTGRADDGAPAPGWLYGAIGPGAGDVAPPPGAAPPPPSEPATGG